MSNGKRGGGKGQKKRREKGGKIHLLVGGFSTTACDLPAKALKVGATTTNRESATCSRCLEAQSERQPPVGGEFNPDHFGVYGSSGSGPSPSGEYPW